MSERPAGRPQEDIFSVLLIVAVVFVAGATIFLTVRSQQLFGHWNPFVGI